MTLTRWDRPLDELLTSLAGLSLVRDPEHKNALLRAGAAVRSIFAGQEECPRVLITAGYTADPLILEVENAGEDIDRMRDDLAVLGDRLDEIVRLLKKPAPQPATTAGGPT